MSLDETIKEIFREVLREELQSLSADDKLLTAEQVAEMLGYNDVHSVYRLKKEGLLQAVYVTEKALRFRNSEVQRFIRDRKAAA